MGWKDKNGESCDQHQAMKLTFRLLGYYRKDNGVGYAYVELDCTKGDGDDAETWCRLFLAQHKPGAYSWNGKDKMPALEKRKQNNPWKKIGDIPLYELHEDTDKQIRRVKVRSSGNFVSSCVVMRAYCIHAQGNCIEKVRITDGKIDGEATLPTACKACQQTPFRSCGGTGNIDLEWKGCPCLYISVNAKGLYDAINGGDEEFAFSLLNGSGDQDCSEYYDCRKEESMLQRAMWHVMWDCATKLIELGATPDATILDRAVTLENIQLLNAILDNHPTVAEECDPARPTALHSAMQTQNIEVVKAILEKAPRLVNRNAGAQGTPIMLHAERLFSRSFVMGPVFQLLLEKNANILDPCSSSARTPNFDDDRSRRPSEPGFTVLEVAWRRYTPAALCELRKLVEKKCVTMPYAQCVKCKKELNNIEDKFVRGYCDTCYEQIDKANLKKCVQCNTSWMRQDEATTECLKCEYDEPCKRGEKCVPLTRWDLQLDIQGSRLCEFAGRIREKREEISPELRDLIEHDLFDVDSMFNPEPGQFRSSDDFELELANGFEFTLEGEGKVTPLYYAIEQTAPIEVIKLLIQQLKKQETPADFQRAVRRQCKGKSPADLAESLANDANSLDVYYEQKQQIRELMRTVELAPPPPEAVVATAEPVETKEAELERLQSELTEKKRELQRECRNRPDVKLITDRIKKLKSELLGEQQPSKRQRTGERRVVVSHHLILACCCALYHQHARIVSSAYCCCRKRCRGTSGARRARARGGIRGDGGGCGVGRAAKGEEATVRFPRGVVPASAR